jgi:hypothetical protein
MIEEKTAIVKNPTNESHSIKISQIITSDGKEEYLDTNDILLKEYNIITNKTLNSIKLSIEIIPSLIIALNTFKKDKRRKQQIVKAKLVK